MQGEECEQRCLSWNEGNAAARPDLQAGQDRQTSVYFLEKCLEFRGLVSNPLLYKHRSAVLGAGSSCRGEHAAFSCTENSLVECF